MPGGASARWDFSRGVGTSRIEDTGPHGLHGALVNVPGRGMTGSRWTGREMCWRHAPDEYAANPLPRGRRRRLRMAGRVRVDGARGHALVDVRVAAFGRDAEENIPFFVVPPKGTTTASIAVIVSTFTYTIYANQTRPEWLRDAQWKADWKAQGRRVERVPAQSRRPHGVRALDLQLPHRRSGISIASWHRPMLTVRLGFITYPYPGIRGSGLRHFAADTHLTAWLEAKGYDYDILTDQELHDEGVEVLKDYRVVTTGTHPEYHTRETLDALEAYRDGGRAAVLPRWERVLLEGGALAGEARGDRDPARGGRHPRVGGGTRGVLQPVRRRVRRAVAPQRPPRRSISRGSGSPPRATSSGRTTASARKRPTRGSRGCSKASTPRRSGTTASGAHGAAGFELDRADKRLGTPAHAVVAASSENHPPDAPWVLVPEEHLTHIVTWPGEPAEALIRADLTFFETPKGGAVFSTGSITFCGSLPTGGFDNDVSRLLANRAGPLPRSGGVRDAGRLRAGSRPRWWSGGCERARPAAILRAGHRASHRPPTLEETDDRHHHDPRDGSLGATWPSGSPTGLGWSWCSTSLWSTSPRRCTCSKAR